jgi:hypothetical protein
MSEDSGFNMCYDCEDYFVNSFAAFQHCRDVGHDQAWECSKCTLYFDCEESLDEHIEEVHEKYECKFCNDGRTFYGTEALNQHTASKHFHPCSDCSKTFNTLQSLEDHASDCHNMTCTECGQFYKHKSQFDKHLSDPKHAAAIRKHEATNKPVPKPETLRCPFCSSTSFDSEKVFVAHQAAHILATETKKDPIVQTKSTFSTSISNSPSAAPLKSIETSELLGQIKSAFGAITVPSNPSGHAATSSCFGSIPETFPSAASSICASQNRECPGTRSILFQATIFDETTYYLGRTTNQKCAFQSLGFQAPYQNFSPEELRLADYAWGRNPAITDVITPPGSIKCQLCPEAFAKHFVTESALDKHQLDAHAQSKLEEAERKAGLRVSPDPRTQNSLLNCDVCGGFFHSTALLQDHKRKWHTIRCDDCFGVIFKDSDGLKKHQKEVHILPCTTCGERFFHGMLAPAHSGRCLKCEMKPNRTFVDLLGLGDTSDLDTSNVSTTPSGVAPSSEYHTAPSPTRSSLAPEKPNSAESKHCYVEASTQTTIYNCDACVTVFENDEDLENHIKSSTFHEPRILDCYECSLPFPDQIALLKHLESKPHKTLWVLSMADASRWSM